jgi:hypothetical protein
MKQTAILIFFTFFICVTVQAQERKFDFGLNLFPNFSMGVITNDGNTPSSTESTFKEIEIWKPSISANFFVEYNLNERSSIGLGLGYQNNGERTKKLDLFFGVNPNTGEVFTDPSKPSQVRTIYNHHNIEIPIYYKHRFGERFYLLAGTSAIINISNTRTGVKYYSDGSEERSTVEDNSTDFRGLNFSGNFGFGLDYVKKEEFSLFVHPFAQFGILGLSKSASLNRNILSLGISTGIRI